MCGRRAPTKYVEFYQVIGVLVVFLQQSVRGELCKSCINKYFWEYTLICLTLGWWSIISFFLTWFFLINNIARYIGAAGLPSEHSGRAWR
jgi:hypothetical protein